MLLTKTLWHLFNFLVEPPLVFGGFALVPRGAGPSVMNSPVTKW
jgi:hypothetical protein